MTQPNVTVTELDGALGVLPPSAGKLLAVIGPTTEGVANTPATFARVKDLVANFGNGPAVEGAARMIDAYGRPVVLVKSTNAGGALASVSAVEATVGVGSTATVTVKAGAAPVDYYELALRIAAGGTVGTAGITYQTSLDNGRTWEPVTALGTGLEVEFPGAGVSFEITTGDDLVAGDVFNATTTPAESSSAEVGAALDALLASAVSWEIVHVTTPLDAGVYDALETKLGNAFAKGKYRAWIASPRMPTPGETAADYRTALESALGGKSSVFGSAYAAACKVPSGVSGRRYRRPVAHVTAPLEASVDEHINIAAPKRGAIRGVSIRDNNGNPDEHDESINPGLDDARFGTLTTIEGYAGVYVNRARLHSPPSSDFQLMAHRRVINLAHATLRAYFTLRLNDPVIVSRETGFILEGEALEIELGARAALRAALLAAPKASAIDFVLSRTDNLLAVKTMTGQGRVVPLAYPEFINLDVGYFNPALTVETV